VPFDIVGWVAGRASGL